MKKIFVAGHNGMVGSATVRALQKDSNNWEILTRNRKELDLCNQLAVEDFFETQKPEFVINAAGRVGGI